MYSSNFVYLVLNITRVAHFDIWRHLHLQIATSLEGQSLLSKYMVGICQPPLNIYFVWRLTADHLTRLQQSSREIQIEIVLEQSGQGMTAGCGTVGVQHAQIYKPNETLYARRIPIQEMQSPVGKGMQSPVGKGYQPELFATLVTRSTPPIDKHAEMHVAYISESSKGKQNQPSGKSILKKSNTNPTTTNNAIDGPSQKISNEDQQGVVDKTTKKNKNVSFKSTE